MSLWIVVLSVVSLVLAIVTAGYPLYDIVAKRQPMAAGSRQS